ncbi:MAG TPA: heme-binding domain-containing protein [Longimicrobiales bacterium]|nr:heme-binding domain-containing protein [Longimicrobiales bacterium]
MTNKLLGRVVLGVAVVLVGSQLVPVDTSNPPAEGAMAIPAGEAGQILKVACMDCHSHETVWPWYAHITPVKFLVAKHVKDGRRHLNLSTWGALAQERRDHKLEEIVEVVKSGEMPEGSYTWLHPEARLTDAQRYALTAWAEAERARLHAPDPAAAPTADTTVAAGGGAVPPR